MDMKECPGLSNIVQENTGGARTHGGTKTVQKRAKGYCYLDRWREATSKKRGEKSECG